MLASWPMLAAAEPEGRGHLEGSGRAGRTTLGTVHLDAAMWGHCHVTPECPTEPQRVWTAVSGDCRAEPCHTWEPHRLTTCPVTTTGGRCPCSLAV